MQFQPAAREIWARKYGLRDAAGRLVEQSPAETLARVARGLASAEADAAGRRYWAERFEWAVAHGAVPAGRIIANLGSAHGGTLASCAVSTALGAGPQSLLQRVHDAGVTLLAGAGVGYDLSPVVPRAAGGPASALSGATGANRLRSGRRPLRAVAPAPAMAVVARRAWRRIMIRRRRSRNEIDDRPA